MHLAGDPAIRTATNVPLSGKAMPGNTERRLPSAGTRTIVEPTDVSGAELKNATLPEGFSRQVYLRVLEYVDRCDDGVMVVIGYGDTEEQPGVTVGNVRWPLVYRWWRDQKLEVFDELPPEALELWCSDGANVVHPNSGLVDMVSVNIDVKDDPVFDVVGGLRTSRAFLVARSGRGVAVCKKKKSDPGRSADVVEGWTSVFTPAGSAGDTPSFLRCKGPSGVSVSPNRLDRIKPRRRHDVSVPAGVAVTKKIAKATKKIAKKVKVAMQVVPPLLRNFYTSVSACVEGACRWCS